MTLLLASCDARGKLLTFPPLRKRHFLNSLSLSLTKEKRPILTILNTKAEGTFCRTYNSAVLSFEHFFHRASTQQVPRLSEVGLISFPNVNFTQMRNTVLLYSKLPRPRGLFMAFHHFHLPRPPFVVIAFALGRRKIKKTFVRCKKKLRIANAAQIHRSLIPCGRRILRQFCSA